MNAATQVAFFFLWSSGSQPREMGVTTLTYIQDWPYPQLTLKIGSPQLI